MESELRAEIIRAQKKLTMIASMKLTEQEKAAFVPIYDEYQEALHPVNERYDRLIEECLEVYETLTDEQALSKLREHLAIQEEKLAIKQVYVGKFREVLPSEKIDRYLQIANKLDNEPYGYYYPEPIEDAIFKPIVTKKGKPYVCGTSHFNHLCFTDQHGKGWIIVGPMEKEIRNLGNHTIKVQATIGGTKTLFLEILEVLDYEILTNISGYTPIVGWVRNGSNLSLETKDGKLLPLKLSKALKKKLNAKIGCKVWVVGPKVGNTLHPFAFGTLDCN